MKRKVSAIILPLRPKHPILRLTACSIPHTSSTARPTCLPRPISTFRKSAPSCRHGRPTPARSNPCRSCVSHPAREDPITFDEIMNALRTLDGEPGQSKPGGGQEGAQHLDA